MVVKKMRAATTRLLVLSVFLGAFMFPVSAGAQVPFGGPIVFLDPICESPPGFWIDLGPPTPMPLMYLGDLTYPYGPPSHPGQFLLGMAAGGWVPCIVWIPCTFGACPIVVGGGLLMLFQGASI